MSFFSFLLSSLLLSSSLFSRSLYLCDSPAKAKRQQTTHPQSGIQRALAERRDPPTALEPRHEGGAASQTPSSLASGFLALLFALAPSVAERKPYGARPPVLVHEQLRLDLPAKDPQPPPPLVVDGDAPRSQEVVAAQDFAVGDRRDRREDLVVVRGGEDRVDLVVREVDAGVGLDLLKRKKSFLRSLPSLTFTANPSGLVTRMCVSPSPHEWTSTGSSASSLSPPELDD